MVIGAGIAGIAAAAALHGAVEQVTILERDVLPPSPTPRRGVPQGDQLHNLLAMAQVHLEDLLPGFVDRLRQLGCGEGVVSTDTHVFELGLRMPERDLGLRLLCAQRPMIDHAAASLLPPTVHIADDVRVSDLRCTPDGAVSAVIAERGGETVEYPCDLVVDASGPACLAARWSTRADFDVPVDEVHADQWYVSVEIDPLDGPWDPHRFLLVFPTLPSTRGGLMSPAGDGSFHLSLSGKSADPIPRTFDEMSSYAATLEDPVIAERVRRSVPHGEPRVFRKVKASWRRFDQAEGRVPGLLAIGDALAGLNPLFGQGISLIAGCAVALRDLVHQHGGDDLGYLTSSYFNASAEVVDTAWQLGALLDSALTVDHEGRALNLSAALSELVAEDPEMHAHYVRIWHLLEPAGSLSEDRIRDRLVARALQLPSSVEADEGTVRR